MRKLIDAEFGHEVGTVSANEILSRWGHRFQIEGYAVVDAEDEVVATFMDGQFLNRWGVLMAFEGLDQ